MNRCARATRAPWLMLLVALAGAFGLAACAPASAPNPTVIVPPPTAVQPTAAQPTAQPTTAAATEAPTAVATAAPTAVPPTPVPPTPTAAPQAITIASPPAGTLVGSPVVLTGVLARAPISGRLGYRFTNSQSQELGAGEFEVAAGQTAFSAQLNFNAPAQGGDIAATIFERDAAGNISAQATLAMFVAPPQAITITSPPAGQFIGSPMVVTGNLARLPFQSNLGYVFRDSQGQQLGAGLIPVAGQPGRPTTFQASLPVSLPVLGGNIQLVIYDQNAADNAVVASAVLPLQVVPQPQQISFTSPPANTSVGSPVVVTGRTVRYPFQGALGYRITDSAGLQLGVGAFPVTGAPGQGSTFSAELFFNLPQQGGPVQITLIDQNATTGVIIATATLTVQVGAQQQAITIDTPAPFTQVGSPVVITGRTSRYPNIGRLRYSVRSERGDVLGGADFPVTGAIGQGVSFSQSMTFTYPPFGGNIIVEISDVDPSTGLPVAISAITLRVGPQTQPVPFAPEGG